MTSAVDVQIATMFACLKKGDHYEVCGGRCTFASNCKDCSGLAACGWNAGLAHLGKPQVPCWQCDTRQFEALGRHFGLMVSLDYARRTRGVWVGWNDGLQGHMGTSLGDGRTIEARSHALDLGVFPFDGRGWEWAMEPPGLFDAPPAAAPPIIGDEDMIYLPPGQVQAIDADWVHVDNVKKRVYVHGGRLLRQQKNSADTALVIPSPSPIVGSTRTVDGFVVINEASQKYWYHWA